MTTSYTHFGRGEPPSELLEATLDRPLVCLFAKDEAPACYPLLSQHAVQDIVSLKALE